MRKHLKNLLVAAMALTGMAGCGVDAALDCNAICDKYASCYDSNYDTSACESRCRDNAADDEDYKRKADVCDACLTDRACTSATFSCATDCAAVVP
ncbi:hypothetical protein D7Y13_02285 [Corallococcus praedator]|uniref:Lipoprotein n=1 Tax=Corallococcus praedator TaxID=2316724 RepID=A0ABX9QQE6_9BACT|nr:MULTISPECIES: hypothetical protein [Corallococcus]RKH08471.1 hypothetical protein D7X74_31550 [Corallococcus sp. CA047B]RKH36374.1 hypothetical protein D7X75_00980 [Corallococcus sp. CA031C]RKI16590.1 hypothetical protein D7Y13_02285 [Corallococcus praedator]